jgi:3-deoxy-D-manno-octulosonate 8-phosphate phosphatase (KDO 8-P phosphatase)
MNVLSEFKKVTTFIFEVDGVLTGSTLFLIENVLQPRRINIKDEFGLQMAIKNGFKILIISGSDSEPIIDRFKKLGIEEVQMSVKDKKRFVAEYISRKNLKWNELLYMANDLPDIELMKAVGLPCCSADAVPEVLEFSKYISPLNGGSGCVRDVIEKVLRVQDKWIYHSDVTSG